MKRRFVAALIAYGVLIGITCIVLRGQVRWAVLILFGGLLAKTLIAWKAGWHVPDCNTDPDSALHNETPPDNF